jgi:hypothetical protein
MKTIKQTRYFLIQEVDDENDNFSVIGANSDKELNAKLRIALEEMFCLSDDDKVEKIDSLSMTKDFGYGKKIIDMDYVYDREELTRQIRVITTYLY